MAVTIKDIAAAAGVSPSTVSRTCKDSPSISRDTKERIRRIMAQMGYEPNFEAEPSEAFSKTIGIILPSSQRDVYENAFHLEIIRGIGQFCNQRRYVNTVITGEDDAEVLDAAKELKIVVRAGAGYDNVDLEAATAHNVCVMNTPGQNSNAVAELAFGLMVMAVRNMFNGSSGY